MLYSLFEDINKKSGKIIVMTDSDCINSNSIYYVDQSEQKNENQSEFK